MCKCMALDADRKLRTRSRIAPWGGHRPLGLPGWLHPSGCGPAPLLQSIAPQGASGDRSMVAYSEKLQSMIEAMNAAERASVSSFAAFCLSKDNIATVGTSHAPKIMGMSGPIVQMRFLAQISQTQFANIWHDMRPRARASRAGGGWAGQPVLVQDQKCQRVAGRVLHQEHSSVTTPAPGPLEPASRSRRTRQPRLRRTAAPRACRFSIWAPRTRSSPR